MNNSKKKFNFLNEFSSQNTIFIFVSNIRGSAWIGLQNFRWTRQNISSSVDCTVNRHLRTSQLPVKCQVQRYVFRPLPGSGSASKCLSFSFLLLVLRYCTLHLSSILWRCNIAYCIYPTHHMQHSNPETRDPITERHSWQGYLLISADDNLPHLWRRVGH